MNHTEATDYLKATINAFGPGEGIALTQDSWSKLRDAIETVIEQPAQYDCCANCLRPEREHNEGECPKPYTTVWHAWDYAFQPEQPAKDPCIDGSCTCCWTDLDEQPAPEPVAWHEPGAYGNVTVHKEWAERNGWLPLFTA